MRREQYDHVRNFVICLYLAHLGRCVPRNEGRHGLMEVNIAVQPLAPAIPDWLKELTI